MRMSVRKGAKLKFAFELNIEKLKKVEFQCEFGKPRKVSFRNGHSKLCKLHLKIIYIYILFKAEDDLFC